RVTVPRRVGLTPGPAIGAPSVRSAGQRNVSHGAPSAFALSLHAKSAPVSEWSWSDVSRYREQPAYAPEPTTSTLPYGDDAAPTVAGPVGALVNGSEQRLVAALAGELKCEAPATRPRASTSMAIAPVRFIISPLPRFVTNRPSFSRFVARSISGKSGCVYVT